MLNRSCEIAGCRRKPDKSGKCRRCYNETLPVGRLCGESGCGDAHYAKGKCVTHYNAARGGSLDSVQWWSKYLKQKVATGFLEDAACKGKYDEIDFFPERGQDTSEAYAVCVLCPVRLQCLELAAVNQESDGIWGGIPAARRKKWLKAGTSAPEMIRLYDNQQAAKL